MMPPQTMGTHNSYHVAPPPSVAQLLKLPLIQQGLGSQAEAVPASWEATQAPLTEQLQQYGGRGQPLPLPCVHCAPVVLLRSWQGRAVQFMPVLLGVRAGASTKAPVSHLRATSHFSIVYLS